MPRAGKASHRKAWRRPRQRRTGQSGYPLQVRAARALIRIRWVGWCTGLPQVSPDAKAHADKEVAGDHGHHRPENRLGFLRRVEREGGEREEDDHAYRGKRRGHGRPDKQEYQIEASRPHPALLSRTLVHRLTI